MILEGGKWQGVFADAAWKQNPEPGWRSWIAGGMLVEVVENGTLRVYHGYIGNNLKYCCNAACFKEDWGLINEILNTLYAYDPGIGVNKPE